MMKATVLTILVAIYSCFSAFGQCAVSYSDGDADQALTNASAYATMSDYYNQAYGCVMSYPYGFSHTYNAEVPITSPSGRSTTANGGGGTLSVYANLAILDWDDGDYLMSTRQTMTCTFAGTFFVAAVTNSPFFWQGKVSVTYWYTGINVLTDPQCGCFKCK